MQKGKLILVSIILLLFLTSCSQKTVHRPKPPSTIPQPKSSLIGRFLWQEDGPYAYAMLRPAGWLSGENNIRVYLPPGASDPSELSLMVMNLSVFEKNGLDQFYIEPWTLFQQNPSLSSWTRAMEYAWEQTGTMGNIERIQSLGQAVVYAIHGEGGYLRLTAYAVNQGQPLIVVLDTQGAFANIVQLKESGLLEDFLTMVGSVRAIPYQPGVTNPFIQKE